MDGLTQLKNIPVRVVPTKKVDNTALAKTLLGQIAGMLETLLATGEPGFLDLRALPPLGEEGYQFLQDRLGVGEINAQIKSFGRSEIREAAFPGVWWITHFNQDDKLYTEMIEVNFVPDILRSHKDDIALGKRRLQELLQSMVKVA